MKTFMFIFAFLLFVASTSVQAQTSATCPTGTCRTYDNAGKVAKHKSTKFDGYGYDDDHTITNWKKWRKKNRKAYQARKKAESVEPKMVPVNTTRGVEMLQEKAKKGKK